MNLQHERIEALCRQLRLSTTAQAYVSLAEHAARKKLSLADFLEEVLRAEVAARQSRTRAMLAKVAGFPAVKTLEQFDFTFAPRSRRPSSNRGHQAREGAPSQLIMGRQPEPRWVRDSVNDPSGFADLTITE